MDLISGGVALTFKETVGRSIFPFFECCVLNVAICTLCARADLRGWIIFYVL